MNKNSEQMARQQTMLAALQTTFGVVRKAARIAQITTQTHYNWYKDDEEYRDRVDTLKYEAYEDYRDLVLEAMLTKLKEGNTSVINRSFQTFFKKWADQMDRANPYRPRLTAKIEYIDKPRNNATM